MTHAPGPWRLYKDGGDGQASIYGPKDWAVGSKGFHMISVWTKYDWGKANAHLVAAAPDLLAALEAIVKEDLHWADDEGVQAAIAKAKPCPDSSLPDSVPPSKDSSPQQGT